MRRPSFASVLVFVIIAAILAPVPLAVVYHLYRYATNAPGPIRVVDGDTIERDGTVHRLAGYDAPETGGRAKCSAERLRGTAASGRLRDLIDQAGDAQLTTSGLPDRYGRPLSRLMLDATDVASIAIQEGWGMPYDGRGKRTDWCAPPPLSLPERAAP